MTTTLLIIFGVLIAAVIVGAAIYVVRQRKQDGGALPAGGVITPQSFLGFNGTYPSFPVHSFPIHSFPIWGPSTGPEIVADDNTDLFVYRMLRQRRREARF